MGGDITNEVLAERLDQLRRDQHDDLADIKTQLAQLVPREVYDAHRVADAARIAALEKRADIAEAERHRDAKAAADQQRQLVRWLIAMVAIPLLSIVVNFWLSTHGVKP